MPTRDAILAAVALCGSQAAAARHLKISKQRISVVMAEERGQLLAHQPIPGRPPTLTPEQRQTQKAKRAAAQAAREDAHGRVVAALVEAKGNAAEAAKVLGVGARAVQRRIERSKELQVLLRELGVKAGKPGRKG